ncbi:MAG TPA: DNA mismatch repair endonuclease MutL [Candidatus Cybelea sp.]|nr:DNA mismatch repair endonuclease MutL [Candidatus Cybelea sp.]
MSRIRILPESVANKIAAGEVIERPASVVKELLENALDAGARSIRIETESGGKRLIRVVDDGCGMNQDDALLAFERHATSKLRTADDLLSITTLGFRGEALPSIAAVSRLVLETRTAEAEQGTRVEFAGGKLVTVKPAGVPAGTSIGVGDIFYSMPARRKFLKSEPTELGHIASLVTHYALAHPECQFLLRTPSQEILHCTPVEKLADRVYQMFGRQALDELVEIPVQQTALSPPGGEREAEEGEEAATLRVSGFTSRPEVQRANRNGIYIFVNRRLVRDRLLLHAIGEAYRNIMPPGAFPVLLLFLDLPYPQVDVNVHPAKIEVRFRHAQFVHDFTRDSLRGALAAARPIPGFPAGRARAAVSMSGVGPGAPVSGGMSGLAGYAPRPNGSAFSVPPRANIPDLAATAETADVLELRGGADRFQPQKFPFGSEGGENFPLPARDAEAGGAAQPSASAPASLPRPDEILDLKPLGQVNSSFIVAVNGEGLWLIDQHVAHERVLFERHLRARRDGELGGQRMLAPIVVELSPRQLATFERIADELRANGFEAELMGGRSVAIQAAPAGISSSDAEKLLYEILDGIAREDQAISIDMLQSKIAASTACHAAIKVNTPLEQTKMEWLLSELARTEYPMSCPHGRPVVLRYSLREIERAFKRI